MATTGSTLSFLPKCSDESSNRDEGDGSCFDVIVDWSKHGATGSVLERFEAGWDVDLNLGGSVEADSGAESISLRSLGGTSSWTCASVFREKLSGNLCADSGWGRDIDLNMSKRDEADSGLDRVLYQRTAVFNQLPCPSLRSWPHRLKSAVFSVLQEDRSRG